MLLYFQHCAVNASILALFHNASPSRLQPERSLVESLDFATPLALQLGWGPIVYAKPTVNVVGATIVLQLRTGAWVLPKLPGATTTRPLTRIFITPDLVIIDTAHIAIRTPAVFPARPN